MKVIAVDEDNNNSGKAPSEGTPSPKPLPKGPPSAARDPGISVTSRFDPDRFIELLKNDQEFPGIFDFRFIVDQGDLDPLLETLRNSGIPRPQAVPPLLGIPRDQSEQVRIQDSTSGKYKVVRVSSRMESAEDVLAVYNRVQIIKSIICL